MMAAWANFCGASGTISTRSKRTQSERTQSPYPGKPT